MVGFHHGLDRLLLLCSLVVEATHGMRDYREGMEEVPEHRVSQRKESN